MGVGGGSRVGLERFAVCLPLSFNASEAESMRAWTEMHPNERLLNLLYQEV